MLIKAKTLIPKTADKLDLSEEMVSDVINFYYEDLRRRMESLENNRLYIPKIGTFYISQQKIKSSIDTLSHIIKTSEPTTFKEIGILTKKKDMISLQQETYDRILKEKEEYEYKKNLGCKKGNL